MSDIEKGEQTVFTSNNEGYNDQNALQIRLNTKPIIIGVEFYLRGVREVMTTDEHGNPKIENIRYASPKLNEEGVHAIIAWLETSINTQVVQGNIENFEDLYNLISNERLDLTQYLMLNVYNWDVKESEISGIIDMIIRQERLFLSRLVNNGERNSYSNTIQHKESSNNTVERGRGFRLPGFR